MADKPTMPEVQTKLRERITAYSELRAQQEKDNEFYENVHPTGIQKPYHNARTGIGRDIIEIPARRLLGKAADVSMPRKQTDAERAAHTLRTQFNDAFLGMMQEKIEIAFKKQIARGEVFIPVVWDKELLDAEPERKEGESQEEFDGRHEDWELKCLDNFPIDFRALDPMNIYPSLAHDKRGVPLDVVVSYSRTVGEVQASFPKWSNPRQKGSDASVEWVEYWSEEWRGYWADWERVLGGDIYADGVIPNECGFVPFVHVWSGFGMEDKDGKPETKARSILYNFRDRIIAMDRAASFLDSDAALHSHRTGKVTGNMLVEAQRVAGELNTAPGMMQALERNSGIEIELDDVPPVNQGFQMLSAFWQALIEQTAHLSLLSGYSVASSGVQQGMSIEWARADYLPPIRNLAKGVGVAMGMVLRIIETVLEKPVTIRATLPEGEGKSRRDLMLSPDDIGKNYSVEIEFQFEDASAKDIRVMTGLELWRAGAISLETLLVEYMHVKDAQVEMDKIASERFIKESPVLRAALDREAARRQGIEEEEQMALEQEELMRATPPPAVAVQRGEVLSPAETARQLAIRRNRRGMESVGMAGGNYPVERMAGLGQ